MGKNHKNFEIKMKLSLHWIIEKVNIKHEKHFHYQDVLTIKWKF